MKKTPKELALEKVLAYAKEMGFGKAEAAYWDSEGEPRLELFEDEGYTYQLPEEVYLGINLRASVWSAIPEGSEEGIVADTRGELDREIRKLEAERESQAE